MLFNLHILQCHLQPSTAEKRFPFQTECPCCFIFLYRFGSDPSAGFKVHTRLGEGGGHVVRHWAQVQPPLIRFSVNCGQKLADQTHYTTAVKCTLNASSLLLSLMQTNPYTTSIPGISQRDLSAC